MKRFEIGKWRFAYAIGSYRWGWHKQAKYAGSIGFGVGILTYLRKEY